MNCENCIHFDICNENADGRIVELMGKPCFRFKNKDHIIYLPCKMGDTIWIIVTKRHHQTTAEYNFVRSSKLTWLNLPRVLRDFRRTVFLTKEEAELAADAGIPEPSASTASAGVPLCIHYPDNPNMTGCRLLTERLCETRGTCKFCNFGK